MTKLEITNVQIDNYNDTNNQLNKFDSGLNIVCGSNEAGKSTLMKFIKNIFIREKSDAKGYVKCSYNGNEFKLTPDNLKENEQYLEDITAHSFKTGFVIDLDDLIYAKSSDSEELVNVIAREFVLKNAIEEIKDKYDYIIIDCPPSLGLITINSLSAADSVLIPIQCEFYALEGLGQLINTINLIKKKINTSLEIEGIVMTMYESRRKLSKEVADEVRKHFKDKVYSTMIPRNVRLSEAPSHGLPIVVYDKNSVGTKSYNDLAKLVLKANNKPNNTNNI